ncbi:MAG TPA: RsmB/NOP family class I SAM-dependent RNA methyltransferase [Devosia sp.]|nr:RsmB/NOP family class I SAM-dependent RNA methyltransferase [Devosia sp.]
MAKQKATPGLALRQQAAVRLSGVLKGASFAPFSVAEIADGRDRALANRLVTNALRRQGHLDRVLAYLLERGVPKKSGDFEAMLRISLAQILYLPELGDHSALYLAGEAMKADTRTQHLAGLTNAVLRRAQKEAVQLRQAPVALLFPEPLVRKWTRAYGGEATEAFAAALLEGAPLDLTLKDNDPELIAALGAAPILADSVRVAERDRPVEQMPGFAEGRFWVQDFAAALPARLMKLPQGARVLDLCAAPGGKTAQLVKAGYKVTALDNDPSRMMRLHANLQRLGYWADLVTADGLVYGTDDPFDGVLLDAPCSATGTFRRHPEVVWHRDAGDVAGRVALQRGFIERAALLLKPGGTLIYCVCSLEAEEGEQQAEWIGRSDLGLEPLPVTTDELSGWSAPLTPAGQVRTHSGLTLPGGMAGRLDGFFVARFRKR